MTARSPAPPSFSALAGLPNHARQRIETLLTEFEDAWRRGERPAIDDFLANAPDEAERYALLVELVHQELELGLQAGASVRVEAYLEQYPALAGNAAVDLIEAEYHFRVRAEPGLPVEDYFERFPQWRGELQARFPPTTVACAPAAGSAADTAERQAPKSLPRHDPARSFGRYQRLDEVGQGGMAEVWRARDLDLDRDLAVKVLKERWRGQSELERRFREEARITGQLQHPGIPPVHEVGRLPDGRPFFAMKLIQGRTLDELLRERPPDTRDLPRFLAVFGQVAQTLAYAHSRGVIHRDLKPANVMVGAFGEVQVMDWGLAKVPRGGGPTALPSLTWADREVRPHDTQVGTVLGTPAYMAPEQARGEVDGLDERADVFGLGAILCVILCGQPPYRGTSAAAVQAQAAAGELGEALARLDACGADAELVRLAQGCLAPEKKDRPRDAGVVAQRVTAHLARVQERLRAAEVERAAAQARAEEAAKKAAAERRARRLLLGLAAAGVVFVVLGTAAGVYRQQQRQRAREQAEAGLRQAAQLREEYRFQDAQAMLDQVGGWAVQAADQEVQRRLTDAERDLKLVRELDELRQKAATSVEGQWGRARVRSQYPELLAEHGMNVLEGDVDQLAERIRTSAVRERIVASLDDWARVETDPRKLQRVLVLANRADERDPWRQGVRQALVRKEGKRLRQLLRETRTGKPTPGVVLLLAQLFGVRNEEATALLRQMQRERPRDFWVHFTLGIHLQEQQKDQEAAECSLVAVVLRPDSAPARTNLGSALQGKGKVDEAIECYRLALSLDPNLAVAHSNLGSALHDKGKQDEAIACYRKAVALDPLLAPAHYNLANALQGKGKVDEAIRCYHKVLTLDPRFAPAHYNLGNALKGKGKVDEAIRSFRKALALNPKHDGALNNLGNALKGHGKLDEAIECFQKAIALDPKLAPAHSNLGLALAGKGKVDEAIACYRKALALDPNLASAHSNLGRALHDKGKVGEAIGCFRRATALEPGLASAHHNLGNALRAKGKTEEAIACFRRAIALDPKLAPAYCQLGVALHGKGQVEEAIACWRQALALDPRNTQIHYNLGIAFHGKGMAEEAIAAYREAIRLKPDYAEAHCNLGQVLRRAGRLQESLAAIQRGHQLGLKRVDWPYPSAAWVRQARQLDERDRQLTAVLKGKATSLTPAEQIQLGDLARLKKLHAASARLYRDAFSRQPELAAAHRYGAARAAAQAGTAQGKDAAHLDDGARAELRYGALSWLQEELTAHARELTVLRPGGTEQVRQTLLHWQKDPDLAPVRNQKSLRQLPEAERVAWRNLWAQVETLLARSTSRK